MLLKSRLSVLLAVAALPLAACGDSGSGSGDPGADPAKIVPADAPLYVEAVVRPDGDLKTGANDALKKLLRTDDPGAKIVALFDKATAGSANKVTWDDLKDWLGPRVGVYLSKFGGSETVGAVVADTTDTAKAKAGIDKIVKASTGDVTSAMVGDYAVVGSSAGVKAVQAAAADSAKSLAALPDYQAARDAAGGGDALAVVYVKPQALIDAVAGMGQSAGATGAFGNPQALGVIRQLAAKAGRAAAVSLHADGSAVRVQGATIGAPAGSSTTAAADSLAALPADAWLALGFGDLGKSLTNAIAQFSQIASVAGSGAPDFSQAFATIQKRLGIDIRQDFLSWMGDGAIYARGHSIADVGGAITIKTKDPAKSRKAVGLLAQALGKSGANVSPAKIDGYDIAVEVRSAQAPISVFIAANNDRFTLGVNPQAMSDLLAPSDKLGDSATYDKATKALGGDVKPILVLDTQTIVGLLESFGVGQAQGYDKVKPYLDALGPISAGTSHDGDVSRFAFALGLR